MTISYMNKDAAISDFLERYMFGQWLLDVAEIDEVYNEQQSQIDEALAAAFKQLLQQADTLHQQGKKGKVRYIYLSYLRTSIMEERIMYRLDAYDSNWYLDPIECTTQWEPSFIFNPLFRRMKALDQVKKQYARKITAMDLEQMMQIEAIKYHGLALEMLKSRLPFILDQLEITSIMDESGLTIAAGEYRDETELLYEYGQDGDTR